MSIGIALPKVALLTYRLVLRLVDNVWHLPNGGKFVVVEDSVCSASPPHSPAMHPYLVSNAGHNNARPLELISITAGSVQRVLGGLSRKAG